MTQKKKKYSECDILHIIIQIYLFMLFIVFQTNVGRYYNQKSSKLLK